PAQAPPPARPGRAERPPGGRADQVAELRDGVLRRPQRGPRRRRSADCPGDGVALAGLDHRGHRRRRLAAVPNAGARMKFWLGVFLGALAMGLYAYRSQIRTLIEGRKAISSGEKVVEGGKT